MTIKEQIMSDMKAAMKAHEMDRLGAIRLLMAAIKQKEVDERIQCTDADILAVVAKLVKQRHDYIEKYTADNRQDLPDK